MGVALFFFCSGQKLFEKMVIASEGFEIRMFLHAFPVFSRECLGGVVSVTMLPCTIPVTEGGCY